MSEYTYELMDYCEYYGYIAINDTVIAWCKMPELPEIEND